MRLKELVLENFQGIHELTITSNGDSFSVYGTNGVGKTTIGNSISWLLFDKPIDDVKNYSPKTKDLNGRDVHHLHHSAQGTFVLDDGSMLTLKKDFYEVYKKKRGSAAEEFSGHNTDYFVDGVPVKQKEYQSVLDGLFSSEQAKVLTNPDYFARQMNWSDRRKVLLEVCGDISDDIVITSTKELAQLPEYLLKPGSDSARYSVEEFMAIAANKRSELNKKMQEIPTRIDEAQKAKPELPLLSEESLDREIAKLRQYIDEKQTIAASMTADEAVSQMRIEINEIRAKMAEGSVAHIKKCSAAKAPIANQISALNEEKAQTIRTISTLTSEILEKQVKLRKMEALRAEVLEEYKAEKAKEWAGSTVCPTCGQDMPEGKIASAIEQFNLAKSRRLEAINQRGKTECSKDMIAALNLEIEVLIKDEADAKAAKDVLDGKIRELSDSVILNPDPAYEDTAEYATYAAQIAQIEQRMQDNSSILSDRKQAVMGEITKLRTELNDWEQQKSRYSMVKLQDERIAQLEAEEKRMAEAYENIQHGIYLCEMFVRRKVEMLDERINGRFKNVRFRLFKEQINGGLQEDCMVLCKCESGLVPYDAANNASRINAGIEIIETLANHWNVALPVIVDNAESVVNLYPADMQVIRLVVSRADGSLRVERDILTAEKAV